MNGLQDYKEWFWKCVLWIGEYIFHLYFICLGSETEDLRQELLKCELHNEQLLTELKARERDILAEKREAEKVRHESYLCWCWLAGCKLTLNSLKYQNLNLETNST
jgi:hypothetical protein